jgi:anti-sigma B factor antagonist
MLTNPTLNFGFEELPFEDIMFQVEYKKDIQTIFLSGIFDASKAEEVKNVLEQVENSIKIDMSDLEFICSSGIGILVMTYRKLKEKGEEIHLVNLNEHIDKVFRLAFLDKLFNI